MKRIWLIEPFGVDCTAFSEENSPLKLDSIPVLRDEGSGNSLGKKMKRTQTREKVSILTTALQV